MGTHVDPLRVGRWVAWTSLPPLVVMEGYSTVHLQHVLRVQGATVHAANFSDTFRHLERAFSHEREAQPGASRDADGMRRLGACGAAANAGACCAPGRLVAVSMMLYSTREWEDSGVGEDPWRTPPR